MSENLINVEDDTPVPAAETPAPVAPPETPPEVPVASTEGSEIDLNAIDIRDEGRVKGIIGELSRMREQNRTLKSQAERATQLEAELNQAKPYVDFLRANPHLTQPRQPEPQTPPPQPSADPDAEEAARLMDFYKSDGSLNIERGAAWLALQDKRSGRVAQQAVQPLANSAMTQQAYGGYTNLRAWAASNGLKPETVDYVWTQAQGTPNGMQWFATKEGMTQLALIVAGAEKLTTPRQPAPPAAPPVVTEGSGGSVRLPAARLSAIEENVLKHRGMSASAYQDLTKGFKAGVSNVLEED